MRRLPKWGLTPFLLTLLTACSSGNFGYDAKADPFALLESAKTQARAEGKRILVVAGGEWCSSCRHLYKFLEDDAATQALLDRTFVQVHVYIGDENFNDRFFATLPSSQFVPHYWILSAEGTVLGEQDPEELELDDSDDYDPERFARFAQGWST